MSNEDKILLIIPWNLRYILNSIIFMQTRY